MYTYEALKRLAKERGCKVTDFVALAPQNDPFYTGSPGERALAEWFATLWDRFGYSDNVHIRRVHYQIVSQDPPMQLERILTSAILRYYDNGLSDRVSAAIGELARDVEVVRRDVPSTHSGEISELRRRYEAIRAEFAKRVADYNRNLGVLWETITEDLQAQTPDLDEYPIPTGREADELGEGLYNSQRNYLEQIEVYKQFQGK